VTEAELSARVLQLIKEMQLLVHRVPDSRRVAAGWPDLTIVGRAVLFRELKNGRGTLSPEQVRARDYLRWARADWAIWQPRDLRSGRIESELEALA
jgi:hypothetical protein